MYMAQALEQQGHVEQALHEYDTTINLTGGNNCVKAMKAHAHAIAGDKSSALRMLEELIHVASPGCAPSYDIAATYAALKDPGKSITWLQKACLERNMKVFALVQDPRFDSLRGRIEFKRIMNQVLPARLLTN
jgi:hypothetical protein